MKKKIAIVSSAGLLGLFFYWMFWMHPVLHLQGACAAAPFFDVRADQKGRIAIAPLAEGASIKQGDRLISFDIQEELLRKAGLEDHLQLLQKRKLMSVAAIETAIGEYLTIRGQVDLGNMPADAIEVSLAALQDQQIETDACERDILASRTELVQLEQQIEKKAIKAPYSGTIIEQKKREGDLVERGEKIYACCDLSQLWVEAVIPEELIAQIRLRQRAIIRFAAEGHRAREGEISWIAPIARADGSGVPIRLSLKEPAGEFLRPNLTARVKICL